MRAKTLDCILVIFSLFTLIEISHAQFNEKQFVKLSIGDTVTVLRVDKWIKGGDFVPLEKGKVFLVDFWATWCLPCVAEMPHLSFLQQKYKQKGLEVIAITSEDNMGNNLEAVRKFVQKRDSIISFNVAWAPPVYTKDSLTVIVMHPWLQATKTRAIPKAFLIDKKGRIVFIGDALSVDDILDRVIDKHYDITELIANSEEETQADTVLAQFNNCIKSKNYSTALKYGHRLLSEFQHVKATTYIMMASQVAKLQQDKEIDQQLLNIGYQAAVRGVALTRFEQPAYLDLLATIYAARKDFAAAIITEKLAVDLSDGDMKKDFSKQLQSYLSKL